MKNNEVFDKALLAYGQLYTAQGGDVYGTRIALLEESTLWIAGLATRLSHESFKNASDVNDIKLLRKLIKAGDEHAKAVRGITFTVIMTLPRYMWSEMDTYTVGVTSLGSTSTMHKEAKNINGYDLVKAKGELTEDTLQTRVKVFSIQAIHRIIKQRKSHRLPQWQTICNFFEELQTYKELYGK